MYFFIGAASLAVYLLVGMIVATVVLKLDTKHYEREGGKEQDDFKCITWLWPLMLLCMTFVLCQECLDKVFKVVFKNVLR